MQHVLSRLFMMDALLSSRPWHNAEAVERPANHKGNLITKKILMLA
jgi:hypothetical protein